MKIKIPKIFVISFIFLITLFTQQTKAQEDCSVLLKKAGQYFEEGAIDSVFKLIEPCIERGYDKKEKLYEGAGCDECLNTGYLGRMGIYELLVINDALKKLIMTRVVTSDIKNKAIAFGMRTLREDGWEKVRRGFTTVDEVIKVTQEDEFAE